MISVILKAASMDRIPCQDTCCTGSQLFSFSA